MFKKEKEERDFGITGIKKGGLFFSNSIEVLLEHLKENLFKEGPEIFAERWVIVPSQGIQQWIQTTLASHLSVSCGFSYRFLNKAVEALSGLLFGEKQGCQIPNKVELFLRLEEEIERGCQQDDPLWRPLHNYLKGKERRKIDLAKMLAELFLRYGIYGGKAVQQWESSPKDWQQQLWAKIFSDWDYPQRTLISRQPSCAIKQPLSCHLFAFSHLSPLHFHFFNRLRNDIPVYLYHLSPCQEFWSDLTYEHPSLLGSLGRVGKEMARLVEESDLLPEEGYLYFGGNTSLRKLQRELLSLQEEEKMGEGCDSIELFLCSTPHREIENLYQKIHTLLATTHLEPKDIIVMAPQIALFAPYIEAIFDEKIPYQIADMPMQRKDPLIEALFAILDLEDKRWSALSVLELFNHPLFRKKHRFSENDLLQIRQWVESAGIRWGVEKEHALNLLKKGHCHPADCIPQVTWMDGFSRLIEDLARPVDPDLPARIDYTEAELLGEVITLIRSLADDLKNLECEKTLFEWGGALRALVEKYLVVEEEGLPLFIFLEKLEKSVKKFSRFETRKYSFALFYALLKEYLGQESVTVNRHACQAIRFCSLLPMRALPARVICLVGMNHDAFPRKEEFRSLDLLKNHPQADYYPSKVDFDRYLFLEALLSAREKLIISYQAQDPFDLTELPPSSVVEELLAKVEAKVTRVPVYNLQGLKIKESPPFSIRINPHFTLPEGDFVISMFEIARFVRSGLAHYCAFRGIRVSQDESIEEEETFILTPLQKGILRQESLKIGPQATLIKAVREGVMPAGVLGAIAEAQLNEEMQAFADLNLAKQEIAPLTINLSANLRVTLVGSVENVSTEGICLGGKCELRNAVKAWPNLLVLNLSDPSKHLLRFAGSNEIKTLFTDDPLPHLKALLELFFYAQEHLFPLVPEWVGPILERDSKKMAEAVCYDPMLHWHLQNFSSIDGERLIEACAATVERVYGDMAHEWF